MLETHATVFVVDADASVRANFASLIRRGGLRAETFESRDAWGARTSVCSTGCLIVDLAAFDLECAIDSERRERGCAELPVIVVARKADVLTGVRAMKAGAVDFLTTPIDERALLDAVHNAIARSIASSSQAAEVLALRDRVSSLSRRERQVMKLVVAGQLNKQVGSALGISEITVKAHRGRMMRKMKANSLAGLVLMAVQLQQGAEQLS